MPVLPPPDRRAPAVTLACLSFASCAIDPVLIVTLDPSGGGDAVTAAPDDDCPLGPLPPVWSVSEPAWQVCLAVVDGALVLGGGSYDGPARLDAIPLAPGGAPAWSHVGPSRREYGALALAGDGTIVAAAADWSGPARYLWLGRFAAAGALLESHAAPQVDRRPTHLQIAANGDLVVLAGPFPGPSQLAVFDAAGELRWVHTPPAEHQYSGLALGAEGQIHVVGTRRAGDPALRRLLLDTFTPAGALAWQRALESPTHVAGPQLVAAPDGQLLVAAGEQLAAGPDAVEVAAIARFDGAGELQWWRTDPTIAGHSLTAGEVVALPDGGVFVAWRSAGDDAAAYVLARYDAGGAQVYAASAAGVVHDLAAGPDGLIYSLEAGEWGDFTRVVPYAP